MDFWVVNQGGVSAGHFNDLLGRDLIFLEPKGPHPRSFRWDQTVAQRLLEPTMELFKKWGCGHTGLFTFSHSPKHISKASILIGECKLLRREYSSGINRVAPA
jgi:hypothetical protein